MIDSSQIEATTLRYRARAKQRARNERLIKEGRYLEVDSPERIEKFFAHRAGGPLDTETLSRSKRARTGLQGERLALERVLGTSDLIGVSFLERGLQVARTVGRIWIEVQAGRALGYGTGFLISPRLLLTNHHVFPDKTVARNSIVEFDYQVGLIGGVGSTTTFALDPDSFFFADRSLDYAVVAVTPSGTGGRELSAYGWNPLIEQEGKAIISQWMNIIQHPNGEPKQLGFRENQLVDLLDDFLHYKTDTAPGSSGSPVFNDRWEVVGLHHSGVWDTNPAGQILAIDGRPWTEDMGEHRIKWIANEGVRVSRLIAHLRKQQMTAEQQRLFDQIFTAMPLAPEARQGHGLAAPSGLSTPHMSVTADGSATWTIPISVSVRIGGSPTAPAISSAPARELPPQLPAGRRPGATGGGQDLNSILESAQLELGARPDVLGVNLGYVFKNGWITDDRALVVTVRRKVPPAALREGHISPLPESFQGLPVEVTNPSVEDMIRRERGPLVAEEAFGGLATLREEITYIPPAEGSLQQIEAPMRVVAHVSPDAGWPQLSKFLDETRDRLVVGMYDFGAPHIADAVSHVGQNSTFDKLTLIMQKGESVGEGTKANDLKDTEVVEKLSDALGDKFENAWVKIGRVNGWVSSSYHIKVAVRDQKAFWLSSGNWQSSNQPDADPLKEDPPRRTWLSRFNREWHAIVEHPGLAKTFERYLLHDFANNGGVDAHEELDLPDVLVPETFFLPSAEERAAPFQYFEPFDKNRVFRVTPLLTPDNYHAEVLKLVTSASDELLIQNQTFNAPKENHTKLRELIDAVIARHEAGVRVQVIFRLFLPVQAREVLTALKDHGVPDSILKVQANCHS